MRWSVACLIAVALAGCAVKQLVKEGDLYARSGDWYAALRIYEEAALRKPADAVVDARIAHARDEAVGSTLAAVDEAMSRGAWFEADDTLKDAMEAIGDDGRLRDARVRLNTALVDASRDALAAANHALAYEYGALLPPDHPDRAGLFDAIRAALRARAQHLTDEHDYQLALAHLDVIATYEPNLADRVEGWRREVTTAWVAWLSGQADAHARKGAVASAWIELALAAAVSGDAVDRRRSEAMLDTVLDRHGVVIGPRVTGSGPRADRLTQAMAAWLQPGPAVLWRPGASRSTISGSLSLAAPRCSDSRAVEPGKHRYQSGVRRVQNPDWAERDRAVRAIDANRVAVASGFALADGERASAERALFAATRVAEPVRRQLDRIRETLDRAEERRKQAEDALRLSERARDATRAYDAAKTTLTALLVDHEAAAFDADRAAVRATAELAEATEAWDAMATDCAATVSKNCMAAELRKRNAEIEHEPAVAASTAAATRLAETEAALAALSPPTEQDRADAAQLGNRAAAADRAHSSEDAARAELDRVRRRWENLDRDVQTARFQVDRAGESLERLSHDLHRLEVDLSRALDRRSAVPEVIEEPVFSVYAYNIEIWTRTCGVSTRVDLRGADGQRTTTTLTRAYETVDRTWTANPRVGLSGDPLRYPTSDDGLIARADDEVDRQLANIVAGMVWERRTSLAMSALRDDDDETRARAFVVAWMVDPARRPDGLAAFLAERFEVPSPDWLVPGGAAE